VELSGEKLLADFACDPTSMLSQGSLTCCKSVTWGKWLYFHSEGRHADDIFAQKNQTASAPLLVVYFTFSVLYFDLMAL
jgi:hypothetical protein